MGRHHSHAACRQRRPRCIDAPITPRQGVPHEIFSRCIQYDLRWDPLYSEEEYDEEEYGMEVPKKVLEDYLHGGIGYGGKGPSKR